jgi:hypothetical protein
MSDAKTQLRAYLEDTPPVTLDEVMAVAAPVPEIEVVRSRGSFSWRGPLIAVGTAVAILVVGAVSMLLLSGDGFDVVEGPASTTLMSPATTTAPPTTSASEIPPTIWRGPTDPITLTLDPPTVPAEIGVIDVTVTGQTPDRLWLVVCSGARGIVNPEDWSGIDTWNGDMAAVCGDVSRGSGTLVNPTIDNQGRFRTILRVPIDAQAIEDGGVVITAGDIWVPLRGNALLQIADDA